MWTPGSEIVGQSVQVNTNGTVNTVYFDQGGVARIMTPGGTSVPGRGTAANQQLCLDIGTGNAECWPYRSAFQTGKVALSDVLSATTAKTRIKKGRSLRYAPLETC